MRLLSHTTNYSFQGPLFVGWWHSRIFHRASSSSLGISSFVRPLVTLVDHTTPHVPVMTIIIAFCPRNSICLTFAQPQPRQPDSRSLSNKTTSSRNGVNHQKVTKLWINSSSSALTAPRRHCQAESKRPKNRIPPKEIWGNSPNW